MGGVDSMDPPRRRHRYRRGNGDRQANLGL